MKQKSFEAPGRYACVNNTMLYHIGLVLAAL